MPAPFFIGATKHLWSVIETSDSPTSSIIGVPFMGQGKLGSPDSFCIGRDYPFSKMAANCII